MAADTSETMRRREFLAKAQVLVGVMLIAPGIELFAGGGEGPAPDTICTCTCTCSCMSPDSSRSAVQGPNVNEYNKTAPPGGGSC
jgi:hypothetical protein